jgi:hypothetical protein
MRSAQAGLMPESMPAPSGTVAPAPTFASGRAAMSAWPLLRAVPPSALRLSSEAFIASSARASKAARRQRTKKSSSFSLHRRECRAGGFGGVAQRARGAPPASQAASARAEYSASAALAASTVTRVSPSLSRPRPRLPRRHP